MDKSKFGVYMEIDSFLDTRLAMVYCINDKLAKSIMSDEYNNRNNDNFGYMSYDVFMQIYNRRNKQLLELATPTKIKYLVYELCLKRYNNILNVKDGYNRQEIPTIYFNTYPYNLVEEEINTLKNLLEDIYHFCEIEMVYMDMNGCNPSWMYKHVDYAIMYYGLRWLEYHVSKTNLPFSPLPGVTLIAPDIIFSKHIGVIKTKDELLEGTKEMYKTLINLEFIYVGNFNSILKEQNVDK